MNTKIITKFRKCRYLNKYRNQERKDQLLAFTIVQYVITVVAVIAKIKFGYNLFLAVMMQLLWANTNIGIYNDYKYCNNIYRKNNICIDEYHRHKINMVRFILPAICGVYILICCIGIVKNGIQYIYPQNIYLILFAYLITMAFIDSTIFSSFTALGTDMFYSGYNEIKYDEIGYVDIVKRFDAINISYNIVNIYDHNNNKIGVDKLFDYEVSFINSNI